MKRVLKAWIHQEVEFDDQQEYEDYKAKNPAVIVIEAKPSDGKKVIAVVKKPYNNNCMD